MPEATADTATVVVSYGRQLLIENDAGVLMPALSRGRKLQVVCGDRVHWQQQADGTAVIEAVLPRQSLLLRQDNRKDKRLLAANVDRLLVVLATQPEIDLQLLDCYLVAAENLDIPAALVFNKTDLLDAAMRKDVERRLRIYTGIGYPLYWTSAAPAQNDAVQELEQALEGHCSVLVGQSGVGKSSLIHRLVPDHQPRTQSLSEAAGTGRHTTTATRLYHLPGRRSQIIDSPGVRDFRLWKLSPVELMQGFREFHPLLGQCRFHNCRHVHEPDCAIRQALTSGRIDAARYQSYCLLLEQLANNHG